MARIPPGKSFSSMVLSVERLFMSEKSSRSTGVSRIIGAIRSLENVFASASLG